MKYFEKGIDKHLYLWHCKITEERMKKFVVFFCLLVCTDMLFAQMNVSIFAKLRADIGKSPARIMQENPTAFMQGESIITSSNFIGFSWAFKNGICVRAMYGVPYDQENWDRTISEVSRIYGEYRNPDGSNIFITWADRPMNDVEIWMVRGDMVCYLYADKVE
jgi:hypothetical protein